jgi:hypothetical protein
MKYKPYSLKWTRYKALEESLYDYLEDPQTSPEEVCEDIRDVFNAWISKYSSRVEKGKILQSIFSTTQ